MQKLSFKRLLLAATLPALVTSGTALGQSFPSKPIAVIIAGGTGTTLDITTRLFTGTINQQTGTTLVIDYRGGAGGTIGAAYVAKQPPDGYTVMSTISSYAIAPALYPDLTYDPLKDLAPITQMTEYHFVLITAPSLPVKTLAEYLAYVKTYPGKVNFGTSGQGSSFHMAGALLHYLTKTEVTFIHYKTGTQRAADFVGGRLNAQWATGREYGAHIKAGRAIGLGLTSATRNPAFGDIPTLAEQGVAGYEFSSWNGFLAPGRTPAPILNQIQKMFVDAGRDPGVVQKMDATEQTILTNTPEAFRQRLAVEIPRWKEVVKAAQIKLDN